MIVCQQTVVADEECTAHTHKKSKHGWIIQLQFLTNVVSATHS